MDGTGHLFDPFIAALWPGAQVRVIRYPPTEALDYAALESLVFAQLPVDRPYIILGESFSGPLAVAIAAKGAPNCVGLILCCTFVRNPHPALSVLRPLLALAPLRLMPLSLLCHLLLGQFSTASLRAAVGNAVAEVSPAVMRTRLASVLSVDVSAEIGKVAVPLLYLQATSDRLVPRSASSLIAALNGNTRIVEIDGPHCLLQASPSTAINEIYTFVRKIDESV